MERGRSSLDRESVASRFGALVSIHDSMNSAELLGLVATLLLIFLTVDTARSMRAEEERISRLVERSQGPWQSSPRIIEQVNQ